MFADGPWCGSGMTAFDADLLRIRRIRVTLRLQAGSTAVRGPGTDFSQPGFSRSAWLRVPDAIMRFDVSPVNLRQ
jgi:hypothetical protein